MARAPRKHKTVKKDGYELTFYPGFVREASVEDGGERDELYRQKKPYDLRGKPDEPLTKFMLRLKGGKNQRNVTFRIDDPDHAIAEIVVRFHRKGFRPGEERTKEDSETLTVENTPILCPPICE